MTIQEFFEQGKYKGTSEFRCKANGYTKAGELHLYMHPFGIDGETIDLCVKDNTIRVKPTTEILEF